MTIRPVYCAGVTPALSHARLLLSERGVPITDSPQWNTGHLLLDVPSFRPGSPLAEGTKLDTLLSSLPRDVTVWGGNFGDRMPEGCKTVDLLKDEDYLTENAAITADCTLSLLSSRVKTSWDQTPTLIIGWGRIGKRLAPLLGALGCPVTLAVRSGRDLDALGALGYDAVTCEKMASRIQRFRLVINTAPAPVLSGSDYAENPDCLKIDLASKKGIEGQDVVWARGLPGIYAPERSGKLIADTFLRLVKEETP